jgi:iron complex outermembrane receptor protein
MKSLINIENANRKYFFYLLFLGIILLIFIPGKSEGQNRPLSVSTLKNMSLDELMNIEVTSVSRQPEKLSAVASAIQVITQEDIRRSGATCLPDALRLASNLQVAQINAYAWIISARGFNASFSNKLLVLIDGRSVYSPLFAGVYWDAQGILLEDVDRIEVISGPGGTLWGGNAVNGVVNIITKSSKETRGLYASATAGTFTKDIGSLHFGGNVGNNFSYRAYAQRNDYGNTVLPTGKDNKDKWGTTQGGFRMDWNAAKINAFTVEGDLYGGNEYNAPTGTPGKSTMEGQNIKGQWSRTFSDKSNLLLQAYFDRTTRKDIPSTLGDRLETYDVDLQHSFTIGKYNNILWGAGYRYMHDSSQHTTVFAGLLPTIKDMYVASGFVQDEILIHQVKVTVGTKLQYNNYSHFEIQPSVRMAWTLDMQNTLWAACSRAVRTPSRIDVDYYLPTYPVPPTTPNVDGGPNFKSESVIAYELGYRVRPVAPLSLSLATFYNKYYNLYSVEALPGTLTYQTENGTQGYSEGVELSGTYQPFKIWQLRGGYTYFFKKLEDKPGHTYDFSALGNDPQNVALLQSMLDLPANFQLDIVAHYYDKRPNPHTASYFTFDVHLAWTYKHLEVSVTGQNLWQKEHIEFGTASQVPRGVYGKLTYRL